MNAGRVWATVSCTPRVGSLTYITGLVCPGPEKTDPWRSLNTYVYTLVYSFEINNSKLKAITYSVSK